MCLTRSASGVFAGIAGPVEKKEVDVKKTVKVDEGPKVDVVIGVRELDEVLMKDVGDKIAQSGKWVTIFESPISLHLPQFDI